MSVPSVKELLKYEKLLQSDGYVSICGMDEAGRGPLAGPVAVAGVIMPLSEDKLIEGVYDSKKLSEKRREQLCDKITETAIAWHVALISNEVIDEINILNATKRGFAECAEKLQIADAILTDAVKIDSDKPLFALIHGDALSYNIAAASIVAKVTRDRLMQNYDSRFWQYGLAKNKGYGTAQHIEALRRFGPCPIHRKTFISKFVTNEQQIER